MSISIPQEVNDWFLNVFAKCNLHVSERLSNNPNMPETSLDTAFVSFLAGFSSPKTFACNWTVRIDTHYLGGLRHFRNWEIADIGVLVFFRRGSAIIRQKVALLQSKRLFPIGGGVKEEAAIDYEIGIARLADPENAYLSLSERKTFQFSADSAYQAVKAGGEQEIAIREFQENRKIPVFYMLYNPWTLPFEQSVPLTEYLRPEGKCRVGCKVIPSEPLLTFLAEKKKNYSPTPADLKAFLGPNFALARHRFGWRLEHFIVNLVLGCERGYVFQSLADESVESLFYRRSGPISAALAVTIQLPDE